MFCLPGICLCIYCIHLAHCILFYCPYQWMRIHLNLNCDPFFFFLKGGSCLKSDNNPKKTYFIALKNSHGSKIADRFFCSLQYVLYLIDKWCVWGKNLETLQRSRRCCRRKWNIASLAFKLKNDETVWERRELDGLKRNNTDRLCTLNTCPWVLVCVGVCVYVCLCEIAREEQVWSYSAKGLIIIQAFYYFTVKLHNLYFYWYL